VRNLQPFQESLDNVQGVKVFDSSLLLLFHLFDVYSHEIEDSHFEVLDLLELVDLVFRLIFDELASGKSGLGHFV
jgi:hypothetical protein